jgi:hypothetical protein
MSTTADSTTYGSISNAPGKRDENQQTNKVHTTTNVSNAGAGAVTTTTTVAASYGAAATTVALNATVDAAETAIRTVRRARTNPSTLPTGKVTGLATRKLRLALWLPLAPVSTALVIPTAPIPTLRCLVVLVLALLPPLRCLVVL